MPNDAPVDELATLRAEVQALRAENGHLKAQLSSQAKEIEQLQLFTLLADHALDGVMITGLNGEMMYANNASLQLLGVTTKEECARELANLIGPDLIAEQIASLQSEGRWKGTYWALRPDGTKWLVLSSVFPLSAPDGTPIAYAALARDVTEAYQADQERIRLQDQVIEGQQAILRELSTPLIPISDGVVIMPLIGSIDSARASQVMETLLEGIVAHQAEQAILDITGLRVVDTQIAQALVRVAQAARLLGAEVILTGISADVAQTLVHLGADLAGLVTYGNLQQGVTNALNHAQSIDTKKLLA